MWSLKTGGLLTQVNHSEKSAFGCIKKGGLLAQVVFKHIKDRFDCSYIVKKVAEL